MKKQDLGILIVDDELIVRESLTKWFREDGFRVESAPDAATALKKLHGASWNLVLVDIRMPGMDGIELLRQIKEVNRAIVVIVITAFATVDTAVRALKQGAYDYITKPIDPDYLNHIVLNALEQQLLMLENQRLRDTVSGLLVGCEIIGECAEMKRVIEMVQTVAPTDTSVLIRGEGGTGRELVARAIHQGSPRRYAPLMTVKCSTLPEGHLAAELFGHEAGALPGFSFARKGKIENADNGTLYIDEVADLDLETQRDLVQAFESREFHRIGSPTPTSSNFRLLCSTRKDLAQLVQEGAFREDLYYRISVLGLTLPPLRARRGDIARLAHHFLAKFSQAMNKTMQGFTPEAMLALKAYDWPGNVRELENVIERAMVLSPGPMIEHAHLLLQPCPPQTAVGKRLEDVERRHILEILQETGWNVSRSAAILDIDRVTLYHKIEKYGLKRTPLVR